MKKLLEKVNWFLLALLTTVVVGGAVAAIAIFCYVFVAHILKVKGAP